MNYTKSELQAMKKSELVTIAVDNLIPFDERISKPELIAKILGEDVDAPKAEPTPAEQAKQEAYNNIILQRKGINQDNAYNIELARRKGIKVKPMNKKAAIQWELQRRRRKAGAMR